MDERRICKFCGQYFEVKRRQGWICDKCAFEKAKLYSQTRLKDLHYPNNSSMQHDIDAARELLNDLGYNIDGDVHSQFVERWRRRGVTF
jgi:hypothetical protein